MKDSLIQPQSFKLNRLHPRVMLLPNAEHLYWLKEMVEGSKIKSFGPAKLFHFEQNNGEWSALGGFIGAPLAMMIVELAIAHGAESFCLAGTAGWVGTPLTQPQLFQPEICHDFTGLCQEYQIPTQATLFPGYGLELATLASYSGIFHFTKERLQQFRQQQIQLIDMETAPIASYLNELAIPFRPVLAVTDQFNHQDQWERLELGESFKILLNEAMAFNLS